MSIADRIRIRDVQVLSDNWYVLKKTVLRLAARRRRVADAEPRDLRPRQRRDLAAL
jgi:hypothetical protein